MITKLTWYIYTYHPNHELLVSVIVLSFWNWICTKKYQSDQRKESISTYCANVQASMEERTNTKQTLLSPKEEEYEELPVFSSYPLSSHSFTSSFVADGDDIAPIAGINQFFYEFRTESRKLWYLAAPAIFTCICQYSLGAITQTFAGHVGTLELASFTIENSVIAGLSFGIMV